MTANYLKLGGINFIGPNKKSSIEFKTGINVICGASDTGKSFLAESVDFMLGGSFLKEMPERVDYSSIELFMSADGGDSWKFERSISGGDFALTELSSSSPSSPIKLKQSHAYNRTDNVSGFLLEKIGLLGKRILKSSTKGTTNSLSFRNLARLIIIQEGEIQQTGSPFWGGQFTLKTTELATMKLLLTGIDDASVVSTETDEPDTAREIALIEELIGDLSSEIEDLGYDKAELNDQLEKLEASVARYRDDLNLVQREMGEQIDSRKKMFTEKMDMQDRVDEINELLQRFDLLGRHYEIDKGRLAAIQESGSLFAHVERVPCPLCGAAPEAQHLDDKCEGDVDAIVLAASAEIEKIDLLTQELNVTVADLYAELKSLSEGISEVQILYDQLDTEIRQAISPEVDDARAQFSEVVEKRSVVQAAIDMFIRLDKLQARKDGLAEPEEPNEKTKITVGIPDSVAHALSMKIEHILRAWNFPGACRVHFDKETSDFVIDGKPRGSRGKGLRAITHAAISVGLLEFCRERALPHPGFVVMDSPLLAYFKPEGEDDTALQGTDLKERFYEYLITHHGRDSQVIIIENQHPPTSVDERLAMTVFTRNPSEGRFGLL